MGNSWHVIGFQNAAIRRSLAIIMAKMMDKIQNFINLKIRGIKSNMWNNKKEKKGSGKQQYYGIGKIMIILIVIAALTIFILKNPSITGRVVEDKETIFSENLNLQVNESGTYEWQVKNPGDIKSIKATGAVTSNGTAKVYIEKNGTRTVLFDSTKQLFDISIQVLPEYKIILQGGELLVQIALANLRGFGAGNVDVQYAVKDAKGNMIAGEQESVFVETQASFVRKLIIPAEINPATYVAFVEVSTNGTILGTGSDAFEVTSSSAKYPFNLKYYLIGAAVFVAFIILLVIGVQSYKSLKKKKEITELERQAPLEKIDKLESELKALESAYNAGFISKESFEKDKKRIEEKLGVSKEPADTGDNNNKNSDNNI